VFYESFTSHIFSPLASQNLRRALFIHWSASSTMRANTALEPTASVPAVSVTLVFIDCPFGCVSPARARGSACDR